MKKNLYINQVFKGIAPSQYFGEEGSYNSATAIDPDLPIVSTDVRTSGFPVPVGSETFTDSEIQMSVMNIITNPKDNMIWTLQASSGNSGDVYSYTNDLSSAGINTGVYNGGKWLDYYNNYMYVFKSTDIDRIGPLNTLPYDAQTADFTVGETVTGGTSGATALIIGDTDGGTTGTLELSNIDGFFEDNETITDSNGSPGSATVARTISSLTTADIWTGATLGSQTALTNTRYPSLNGVEMPNHVSYVHSDGSMYVTDFKDGQGLIHRINTKKVTYEGDTNGTTVPSGYNALDLPFGFYPTCMEGYGTDIIIAGIYTTDTTTNQGNSAFVIWDPTDTATFHTGPIPLADPLVTAMKNVNGSVYIWTGNAQNGVRLSLYNGGVSVRELVYQEEGLPPFAGAVDALGNRVVWGGSSTYPSRGAVVYGFGSKRADLPRGLHSIFYIKEDADTLVDSYSETNISAHQSIVMDNTKAFTNSKAQSFTATAGPLSTAIFYGYNAGGATGTLKAVLYAHSGTYGTSSIPTGSPLSTSVNTIDVATIGNLDEALTFTFPQDFTLVNTTKYVIALEIETLGSGTFGLATDSVSPTHTGNRSYEGIPDSGSWSPASGSDAIFYVYSNLTGADGNVTSLKYVQQNSNITPKLVTSWNNSLSQGIDKYSTTATLGSKIRWMFSIGTKFEIERVSIPLAGAVEAGTVITPTLYFDDLSSNKSLTTINNTNHPAKRKVTYKGAELKNAIGYNNFILEIAYTGTDPLPVALPIKIEIDIKDDEE